MGSRANKRSWLGAGAWLALALVAAGCIEVPKPKPKGALDVRDVESSPGMVLETTCVPTGVERCFDALDDNCNGVIDEGCGVHTGLLQFTIAWQQAAVDVDLEVTGPDGDQARADRPTSAGLLKDRDCPGHRNMCHGQNIENVFLAEGKPRRGRYRVSVQLKDIKSAQAPIKVRLSARVGQRHFSSVVELTEKVEERDFEFTL